MCYWLTYCIVARGITYHYVLNMCAVFALRAPSAWYFWIPKILGLDYNQMLGKVHFWIMFIVRNIAKSSSPALTTILSNPGYSLILTGLTVGLPPSYYEQIKEMVYIMDFLIEQIPLVAGLLEEAQHECLQLGIEDTDYRFFRDEKFPEYSDRNYTFEEDNAKCNAGDLWSEMIVLEEKTVRFWDLSQQLRQYPVAPSSICNDLTVQATWARASGQY